MKVIRVDPLKPGHWNKRLQEFEAQFSYPLGSDSFHIDHGSDYFAFFNRLGHVHCYVIEHEGEMLGVGQGILRKMPDGKKAWYLCDLKVTPKARGQKLTYQLFKRTFFPNYFKSQRGYGISMDPAQGGNPIVKLSENLPWTPLKIATRLVFFTFENWQMQEVQKVVEKHRGPVSFLSHQGKKDLILASTQKPLPLWHIQFGPMAQAQTREISAGMYMLCTPEKDPLTEELIILQYSPSAFAHILHHRMAHTNWANILTSEI